MKILILSFVLVVLALPAGASAGVIGKPTNNLGLAGYWSFNEGRGTSAGDSSGHGYTAAIDGSVTWTSGKLGAALDHPNNNVGSATNYDGNPATVTYTAWIFPRTVGEGGVFGAIAKQGLGRTVGLCSGNAACGSLTNTLVFSDEDWDAVPGVWYTNADTIRMNAWNFVTVTYDRSSDTNDPLMYINGVSVQVNEYLPPSGGVGNSVGTLNIGRGGGTQGLDGKLDELRIYSRILTAAQIADLYKSGSTGSGSYSAQGGSSSLTNGLVGHWTMDGTDVTDKVYDRSGQGNNGYFWGSATSSAKFLGKLGQAMRFNGTTDVVYVGDVNAMDGLTRITVSAWVKSPAAGANGTNEAHIADKSDCTGAAGDGPFDLTQYPGTNKAFFAVYDAGGTGQSNLGTINIDDGNWHFLLGQYDGADVSIWVDGVRDSFQTVGAFTLANTSKPFNIGGYCANAHMSWKGMIDDVRVYNRAISTTEMKQLYNLGSQKMNASSKILTNGGLNSGLVAHWTFDGADVTDKVYDRRGNSHDA